MSRGPAAPDSAIASSAIAASSSSESSAGRYARYQRASASSAAARSLAAALAVGLGGLEAALALAPQHRDLVVAAVLEVLLQRVGDQAQRADAVALARLHRRRGCRPGSARGSSRPSALRVRSVSLELDQLDLAERQLQEAGARARGSASGSPVQTKP